MSWFSGGGGGGGGSTSHQTPRSERPAYIRSASSHHSHSRSHQGDTHSHSRTHHTNRPSTTHSPYTRSSSYYKRRPRSGYITQLLHRLKRLLLDLLHYARRHPAKILFAVVLPLISGGALAGVARQFGVNLPGVLQGGRGRGGGGGYYGSRGYGDFGGGMGGEGGLGGLVSIAKNFI